MIKIITSLFRTRFSILAVYLFTSSPPAFSQPKSTAALNTSDTTQPVFGDCSKFNDREEKWRCSILALSQFISKNIQVPSEIAQTGTVYITFSINELGDVSDIRTLKKLAPNCDSAAIKVVEQLPKFMPATFENKPIATTLTVPIRFQKTDDSELSNGFQLFWGNYRSQSLSKNDFPQLLQSAMVVRDLNGNSLNINELLFERNKKGDIEEVSTRGNINEDASKLIKKMRSGEKLTVIATVQQKGKFFYVEKQYLIE